jgi:hypothetical protein
MRFARNLVVSVVLIATTLAPISGAWAKEGNMHIAESKAQRQAILNYLRARYVRHQTMTSEGIIADLNAEAARNQALLQSRQPDTAKSFEKLVLQETDHLRALGDRDLILAVELSRMQEAESSDNYMLYIMNHGGPELAYLVCTCGDPTISLIFAIFLVPFDIVALPIEFFLSAITGF